MFDQFRVGSMRATLGMVLLAMLPGTAAALNFELGDASVAINSRALLGGAIRLENRSPDGIGKLNLNPDLCPDDCISFTGDPEPNQRLVNAPGAFVGSNFDDGNLNYDRYDLVSAQARFETRMNVLWGDLIFNFSGLAFFDQVNHRFDDFHPDTAFQPRHVRRDRAIVDRIGINAELQELFVAYPFRFGDRTVTVSVGEQRVRWGESTFVALGSLDQLNPPDENRLNFPGSEISSVFRPTGLAVLATDLTPDINLELIYQYRWARAQPAAAGGFYSVNDIAGGGQSAVVGLGQFSEDPMFVGTFKGAVPQLLTSGSLNVPVDNQRGEPRHHGQFGGRITTFATNLNGGTELGFYALNYHSRLPYASTFATDATCLDDGIGGNLIGTGDLGGLGDLIGAIGGLIPGVTLDDLNPAAAGAVLACGGGTGTLGALVPGEQREPLPIGTLRPFLDYPENIHMFGFDFNTQFGNWSLAGEYVFQPNFPLQVSLVDVIFAGLQPALPEEDINVLLGIVPSRRNALPDFLQTRFRNEPVEANQYIRGYERQKVHQLDLTGIRVFSRSNWIGADQIILLTELGMTYVQDMPSLNQLQFEGGGPNCTHFSPGADGTGAADGAPDSRRLNPTQSTRCYADDFSAGYRIFARPQYSNLIFGWTFNPIIGFFHDVYGIAPTPAQNFVEGEIEVLIGTDIEFSQAFRGRVLYQGFFMTGNDRVSLTEDRDNLSFSIEYNF